MVQEVEGEERVNGTLEERGGENVTGKGFLRGWGIRDFESTHTRLVRVRVDGEEHDRRVSAMCAQAEVERVRFDAYAYRARPRRQRLAREA